MRRVRQDDDSHQSSGVGPGAPHKLDTFLLTLSVVTQQCVGAVVEERA